MQSTRISGSSSSFSIGESVWIRSGSSSTASKRGGCARSATETTGRGGITAFTCSANRSAGPELTHSAQS